MVLSRVIEQHSRITFGRGQVSYPQSDLACRQGKSVTQRQFMIGRQRLCNACFGSAYRLIRKPLQPQHAREKHVRRSPRIRPEANDIPEGSDFPPWLGGGVIRQTLLQMPPCTGLVANKVLGYAYHALTKQPTVQV
jgi:hypothetical protein